MNQIDNSQLLNPFYLNLNILKKPPKQLLFSLPSTRSDKKLVTHKEQDTMMMIYEIKISRLKLFSNLQNYEWRNTTDFPIVKTLFVDIKEDQCQYSEFIQMDVYVEYSPLQLNHIDDLNINRAIFLLKEAIVGFQRLFNRFGQFQISQKMISIYQNGTCKVWINQNFALNTFQKNHKKQSNMVYKIIQLVQQHTIDSELSNQFFQFLKYSQTFIETLKRIQIFTKNKKIVLKSLKSSFKNQEWKKNVQNIHKNSKVQKDRKYLFNKLFSTNKKRQKMNSLKINKSSNLKKNEKELKTSDLETSISQNLFSNNEFCLKSPKMLKKIDKQISKFSSQNNIQKNFKNISLQISKNTIDKKSKIKYLTNSEALNFNNFPPKKLLMKKLSLETPKISANNKLKQLTEDSFPKIDNSFQESFVFNEQAYPNKDKISQEQELQEAIKKRNENILKSNGWKNNFESFLKSSQSLKKSRHNKDKQECMVRRKLKFQKLDNLVKVNRKNTAVSFLPNDTDEDDD